MQRPLAVSQELLPAFGPRVRVPRRPLAVAAMSFSDPRSAPRLPSGFEEVLQGMAREVLRAQPDDVLGFITRYFQALLAEREREWAPRPGPALLCPPGSPRCARPGASGPPCSGPQAALPSQRAPLPKGPRTGRLRVRRPRRGCWRPRRRGAAVLWAAR